MIRAKRFKLNICLIIFLSAAIAAVFSLSVFASSLPSASGQINSYDGAILRKSSTTRSARLCVLTDNTKVTIHREVFKSRNSTAKRNKWYYVTAKGIKGYVRADLVDHIRYGTVKGKASAKTAYRRGAGTGMRRKGYISKGAEVSIVLKARPVYSYRGKSSTWYKIKKGGKYYYVSSDKIKLAEKKESKAGAASAKTDDAETAHPVMTAEEFEKYMTDEGFPESYKRKLRVLHEAHPDWGFAGYRTGISWKDALSKQTKKGTSLIYASYPSSYRDGSRQYEKGWYKASRKVAAYYMDPRNFLNEDRIYMFEDLTYKPEYQTVSAVSAILSPTKLPGYGFTAKIFVDAAGVSNVSPVFLASRARQETGGGSDAVNGSEVLGKKVYNPFNIGAFGGINPLYNGLLYAYGKGWTTPKKSVEGGALELSKNYISQGQHTSYYQRFNVRNGKKKAGTHQYMTNIMGPYSEAYSTKTSYERYGITDQPLMFEIPIYESMPASTKLP